MFLLINIFGLGAMVGLGANGGRFDAMRGRGAERPFASLSLDEPVLLLNGVFSGDPSSTTTMETVFSSVLFVRGDLFGDFCVLLVSPGVKCISLFSSTDLLLGLSGEPFFFSIPGL